MTHVKEQPSDNLAKDSNPVSDFLYATNPMTWEPTPDYQTHSKRSNLDRITQVYHALQVAGNADSQQLDESYERTMEFFENSFDAYSQSLVGEVDQVGRVFVVPMRITRGEEAYASEVLPFAPLLDPEFGVNADIRQKTVVGLPPSVLDTYMSSSSPERQGALVLAPLYGDMQQDMVTRQKGVRRQMQRVKLARLVNRHINETAKFSSDVLGAKVMGLGAIIPAITNFGTSIKNRDIITTTGHGGTVDLIVQTTKKSLEALDSSKGTIGVIGGAGSIGYASLDVVRSRMPNQEIVAYDRNMKKLRELVDGRQDNSSIMAVDNATSVLERADVVITAVTTPIDLDEIDPGCELDLNNKIIIDDSQPGSFNRQQVEARNGRLVWVVGNDSSEDGFLERTRGYTYGTEAGLYGPRAVWGCEAEAAVIAASGEYDKAICERVTPKHARDIGKLCVRYGVTSAEFQSYGQPVSLL